MAYRKRNVVSGGIYHVVNRGVDKRKIFLRKEDYFRFIHDLFEFNDIAPVNNLTYFFHKNPGAIAEPTTQRKPRKLLVELLAFCLMPNHYHLLLRTLSPNGLTKFIRKLNMGYAKYVNEKYQRSGALFQGRYKLVAVDIEQHFVYLPFYIHLNPLDLTMPEWRRRSLRDYKKALQFLGEYRWSSHLDYAGKKNFPSVTQRDFLVKVFGNPEQYQRHFGNWLRAFNPESIREVALE